LPDAAISLSSSIFAHVLAAVHNKNIAPKIERLLPIIPISFFIPALMFLIRVAAGMIVAASSSG
jgi:hypothetical protein